MSKELPEPWGSELGPKGIHSYRDLAAATHVGHETLRRLVTGASTSVETVNKVADAVFDGDRNHVWSLRGADVQDFGDWRLPAEASLLDDDQRAAIVAVVKGMVPVAVKRKELRNRADRSAPNTRADELTKHRRRPMTEIQKDAAREQDEDKQP